jgi:hypothetical protein
MTFDQQLRIEMIKLAVGFFGVTLIGGALTAFWAGRQKRREIERLELIAFYALYGNFLTAWRLWNTLKSKPGIAQPSEITRFALLKQASEAEGSLEGLLLKLASERRLNRHEQQVLGKFRQACQRIRQSIREDSEIPWRSSDHPEYVAFKQGASYFASLIRKPTLFSSPQQADAARAVSEITANKYSFADQIVSDSAQSAC